MKKNKKRSKINGKKKGKIPPELYLFGSPPHREIHHRRTLPNTHTDMPANYPQPAAKHERTLHSPSTGNPHEATIPISQSEYPMKPMKCSHPLISLKTGIDSHSLLGSYNQ